MQIPAATRPATSLTNIVKRFGVGMIALAVWLEVAVPAILLCVSNSANFLVSTDDAMRLAEVRDLLGGQNWFDLTQWRMNTPYGVPMHWSRLIDAPIAGLILFFRAFLSPHMAEVLARSLWPLLPLLAAWLAIGRISQRIASFGSGFLAVLLAAACTSIFSYFRPGEIDHHGVHVALTLWTVAFLIDSDKRPRAAAGAAITSAVSIAIGIEALPYAMAAATFVAIDWIVRGNAANKATRFFSLTFAAAALILLFGATATHERFSGACDAFSGYYAVLAVIGGLTLWGATYLPLGLSVWPRIATFCTIGVLLLGVTLAAAPQCLAGPYANMDPRLNVIFLSRIAEAKTAFTWIHDAIGLFFGAYVYSAFAFGATLIAAFLVSKEDRRSIIALASFDALALVVTSFQLRGIPFFMLLGIPGLSATIWLSVTRLELRGLSRVATVILAACVFSNAAFGYFGVNVIEGQGHAKNRTELHAKSWNCMEPKNLTQLNALAPGRVMAFEDQSPIILAYTQDSVVGGPYHRNAQGIIDSYDFFTKPPRIGEAILRKRGIDYVVTCSDGGDRQFYLSNAGKTGLLRRLENHNPPSWLKLIPPSRPNALVRIYRFVHNGAAPKPKNNS